MSVWLAVEYKSADSPLSSWYHVPSKLLQSCSDLEQSERVSDCGKWGVEERERGTPPTCFSTDNPSTPHQCPDSWYMRHTHTYATYTHLSPRLPTLAAQLSVWQNSSPPPSQLHPSRPTHCYLSLSFTPYLLSPILPFIYFITFISFLLCSFTHSLFLLFLSNLSCVFSLPKSTELVEKKNKSFISEK